MGRRKYLNQKDIKFLLKIDPSGWLLGIVASTPLFIVSIILFIYDAYNIGIFLLILGLVILLITVLPNYFKKKKERKYRNNLLKSGINEVDSLSAYDFEEYIAGVYEKLGYKTDTTPKSGDYGIDVIAVKAQEKIGIQVKKYSGSVGVKAVQEVIAGMTYYKCNKGAVVTTSKSFTKEAKNLADVNGIELINYDILIEILLKINNQ